MYLYKALVRGLYTDRDLSGVKPPFSLFILYMYKTSAVIVSEYPNTEISRQTFFSK